MNKTIAHNVDKSTAKDAIMMCLSKAVIYGDRFDYDYTDKTLILDYEPSTEKLAWITNAFQK